MKIYNYLCKKYDIKFNYLTNFYNIISTGLLIIDNLLENIDKLLEYILINKLYYTFKNSVNKNILKEVCKYYVFMTYFIKKYNLY